MDHFLMPSILVRLNVIYNPFCSILAGLCNSPSLLSQQYCFEFRAGALSVFSYSIICSPMASQFLLASRTALRVLKSRQWDSASFSCTLKSFFTYSARSLSSLICLSIRLAMSSFRISLESMDGLEAGGYVVQELQRVWGLESELLVWMIDDFFDSSRDCSDYILDELIDFLLFFSMELRCRQSFSFNLFGLLPSFLLEALRLCVELRGKEPDCLPLLPVGPRVRGSVILNREELFISSGLEEDNSPKEGSLLIGNRSAKLFISDLLIFLNKFTINQRVEEQISLERRDQAGLRGGKGGVEGRVGRGGHAGWEKRGFGSSLAQVGRRGGNQLSAMVRHTIVCALAILIFNRQTGSRRLSESIVTSSQQGESMSSTTGSQLEVISARSAQNLLLSYFLSLKLRWLSSAFFTKHLKALQTDGLYTQRPAQPSSKSDLQSLLFEFQYKLLMPYKILVSAPISLHSFHKPPPPTTDPLPFTLISPHALPPPPPTFLNFALRHNDKSNSDDLNNIIKVIMEGDISTTASVTPKKRQALSSQTVFKYVNIVLILILIYCVPGFLNFREYAQQKGWYVFSSDSLVWCAAGFIGIFAIKYSYYHFMKNTLNNILHSKYEEEERVYKLNSISKLSLDTVFYSFTSIMAYTFFRNEDWFPSVVGGAGSCSNMYKSYPNWPSKAEYRLQIYYMIQLGVHIFSVFEMIVIKRGKERKYYEYLLHHSVAASLILFSMMCNETPSGGMTLIVHDFSDIFIAFGRLFVETRYATKRLIGIVYIIMTSVWIYMRIIVFPFCILSNVYINKPTPSDQWYIISFEYSYLLSMAIVLYGMHIFWTYFLVRIGLRSLEGKRMENLHEEDKSKSK